MLKHVIYYILAQKVKHKCIKHMIYQIFWKII